MPLTIKLFSVLVLTILFNFDGLCQAPKAASKDCEFEQVKIAEISKSKTIIYELQTVSGDLFKGLHCQVIFADGSYYVGIASSNGSPRILCFEQGKSQMEFLMANDSILALDHKGGGAV